MRKTKKLFTYLIINDEHKEGILVDKYGDVLRAKTPRTIYRYPIKYKELMQQVINKNKHLANKMH